MQHRPDLRALRRAAVTLVAVAGAMLVSAFGAMPASASPTSAHRAPGDAISVVLSGGSPDFGYVKQGVTITRTLSLFNEGVDGLLIDPAPLSALPAPFTLVSTTLMAGTEVEPGQTRTITVTYTAPAAGTVSNTTITLPLADFDNPGTGIFPIVFQGHSLDTDRSYFDLTTAAGGGMVDFGTVELGKTVKVSMKIAVRGIDPMKFTNAQVTVLNGSGMPIPGVTLSQSSFGTVGATYTPGQTATFELSFAPTTAGRGVGTLTVTGKQMSGDPEAKDFVATVNLTAIAVTPPTPSPSPTPTPSPSPTGTPTPTPTSTVPGGNAGGGANGAGANSGSSVGSGSGSAGGRSGSLASTGAEVTGLGMGALAVLGCGLAMVLVRRVTRSRG